MSREISGIAPSGTLYARVKNSSGLWWNGTTFEAYTAANYANYVITMTEEGDSGEYVADFPSAITTSGTYQYRVHRTTGSPAEGDTTVNTGTIDWTGTASVAATTGAMTGSDWLAYVIRQGFKRTDKDTEIYEATTDAIQIMRRRFMFDEAEAEQATTDTISVLGDFKLTVESDFGLLLGVTMEDGTNAHQLRQVTKAQFDALYPDINVTADRGYPKHFCLYAGQLYVGPIPDSTSYSYRKSYSLRAGTISSTTTGVPFTNVMRDVLLDLTNERLAVIMEEWDKATFFKQRFEEGFSESKRRERFNSGEHCFMVRPFNL